MCGMYGNVDYGNGIFFITYKNVNRVGRKCLLKMHIKELKINLNFSSRVPEEFYK